MSLIQPSVCATGEAVDALAKIANESLKGANEVSP